MSHRPPRILYAQYTNPEAYPPLEHSSTLLANRGWDVLFLGTGAWGNDELLFRPHERITSRRMPFHAAGFGQKVHYARWLTWVAAAAARWRPDWLYVSDALAAPAGLVAHRACGAPVVYHEHDSSAPPPQGGQPGLVASGLARARASLARSAAVCVVPNAGRGELLVAETGRREAVTVVWNCPAHDEVGPRRGPWNAGDLWLLYHGSISPDRLPLAVVDALPMLPPFVKLRVVGYETVGHPGYSRELLDHARSLDVLDRVDVRGAVGSRDDLLAAVRCSDIGLSLMPEVTDDRNMRLMAGASNKPFEYMAAGLPFLVTDQTDWRDLYVAPGFAVPTRPGQPGAIAASIRQMLDDPAMMRAMGEAGRRRILGAWNYEAQFAPVLSRLESRLGAGA